MDAWPIEDVWARPVATLILAAVAPVAGERALRGLLARADSGDARGPLVGACVALAYALGATALGPVVVASRDGAVSHAFGALAALIALGSLIAAHTLDRRAGVRAVAALATAVAIAQLARWAALPVWPIAAALVGVGAGVVALRAGPREGPRDPLAVGAGLVAAALLAGLVAAAWAVTDVDLEGAPGAGTDASRWRLRVDPWDAEAMLGAGWASRYRGEYARAVAQAHEARRMGLEAGAALELVAEVEATEGHCDRARRTFDRALRARARQVFSDSALTEPLTLGGYRIPPALVTECGGLEQVPTARDEGDE